MNIPDTQLQRICRKGERDNVKVILPKLKFSNEYSVHLLNFCYLEFG